MTTQPVEGLPIHVSKCVYVDGMHVYRGPDCEHDTVPEEQAPGWTVQGG